MEKQQKGEGEEEQNKGYCPLWRSTLANSYFGQFYFGQVLVIMILVVMIVVITIMIRNTIMITIRNR